jgi:hypothetical protein
MTPLRRSLWLVLVLFFYIMAGAFGFVSLGIAGRHSPNWVGFAITASVALVLAVVSTLLFRRAVRQAEERAR